MFEESHPEPGGTVFTRDVEHGLDVARRVETGSIGVNFAGMAPDTPFGGVKSSGTGRESGPGAGVRPPFACGIPG